MRTREALTMFALVLAGVAIRIVFNLHYIVLAFVVAHFIIKLW